MKTFPQNYSFKMMANKMMADEMTVYEKTSAKISLTEKDVHQKFVTYGKNAKKWLRKCVLLLPEIEKLRIWEKKGFNSIYEYAAKLTGMSHMQVDDALRILRKIEDKPLLQKVVEEKGINAVRPVAAIATKDTEEFWAKKARVMSKNTLEVYIKEFRRLPCTSTENRPENLDQQAVLNFESGERDTVQISEQGGQSEKNEKSERKEASERRTTHTSDAETVFIMNLKTEIAVKLQKMKGQGSWNDLMAELLQIREEKLEQEKPEAVVTESRYIPVKIQKYVLARTNGTCSYPGCTKPYNILHHSQRFALEKIHDPTRLQPLCMAHERIAHHGLIENEESSPATWNIRKEPDHDLPKFQIDEFVGRYRNITNS